MRSLPIKGAPGGVRAFLKASRFALRRSTHRTTCPARREQALTDGLFRVMVSQALDLGLSFF